MNSCCSEYDKLSYVKIENMFFNGLQNYLSSIRLEYINIVSKQVKDITISHQFI